MPRFPPGVHLIGGRNAAATHVRAAREFYAPIIPLVVELRRQGLSLRAIARELDRREIRTRQVGVHRYLGAGRNGLRWGKLEFTRWSATHVRRILARVAAGTGSGETQDGEKKTRPAFVEQAPRPERGTADDTMSVPQVLE